MRRRPKRATTEPWTETEDAALVEICRLGLCSEYWTTAIPTRTWGEIAERRMELRPTIAALL